MVARVRRDCDMFPSSVVQVVLSDQLTKDILFIVTQNRCNIIKITGFNHDLSLCVKSSKRMN